MLGTQAKVESSSEPIGKVSLVEQTDLLRMLSATRQLFDQINWQAVPDPDLSAARQNAAALFDAEELELDPHVLAPVAALNDVDSEAKFGHMLLTAEETAQLEELSRPPLAIGQLRDLPSDVAGPANSFFLSVPVGGLDEARLRLTDSEAPPSMEKRVLRAREHYLSLHARGRLVLLRGEVMIKISAYQTCGGIIELERSMMGTLLEYTVPSNHRVALINSGTETAILLFLLPRSRTTIYSRNTKYLSRSSPRG